MKNNLISKIFKMIPCFVILGLILSTSGFAEQSINKDNNRLKTIAKEKVGEYLSTNENEVISDLNEVSNSKPVSVDEHIDSNGNKIKVETRKIVNEEGIEIENTREYITPASIDSNSKSDLSSISPKSTTLTVRDKYGLYWGGTPGGAGNLVAEYKYTRPVVNSPNDMKTKIHSASGYLSSSNIYTLNRIDPNWDTSTSYTPSASVRFYIKRNRPGYKEVSYKNTCTFNSRGGARFSWF